MRHIIEIKTCKCRMQTSRREILERLNNKSAYRQLAQWPVSIVEKNVFLL